MAAVAGAHDGEMRGRRQPPLLSSNQFLRWNYFAGESLDALTGFSLGERLQHRPSLCIRARYLTGCYARTKGD